MFALTGTIIALFNFIALLQDKEDPRPLATLRVSAGSVVTDLAFIDGDSKLVTSGNDGIIRVWDLKNHEVFKSLEVPEERSQGRHGLGPRLVMNVNVNPVSGALIESSGSDQQRVRLWDSIGGQSRSVLLETHNPVDAVALCEPKDMFAVGRLMPHSTSFAVELGFLSSNTRHVLTPPFKANVESIRFSPDGAIVGGASLDRRVRLWDVAGRSVLVDYEHKEAATSIAFSSDGCYVASGGWDGAVFWCEVRDGKRVQKKNAKIGKVLGVAFIPKTHKVMAAGATGEVAMVDLADGAVVRVVKAHREAVYDIAISSDGQKFATGSQDGTARIWRIMP